VGGSNTSLAVTPYALMKWLSVYISHITAHGKLVFDIKKDWFDMVEWLTQDLSTFPSHYFGMG
jgi:hypothetical protein